MRTFRLGRLVGSVRVRALVPSTVFMNGEQEQPA
jgi:hypothetical protein